MVHITCCIHPCKVNIEMFGKCITCYTANLENRCMLLEPELVVCSSSKAKLHCSPAYFHLKARAQP